MRKFSSARKYFARRGPRKDGLPAPGDAGGRLPAVAAGLQPSHVDMTTIAPPEPPASEQTHRDIPQDAAAVPAAETLEELAWQFSDGDGVMLRDLQPGTVVSVETRHSTYRIVVLDGPEQRVLVSGGPFEAGTEARADGATAGGSLLKTGWIGIGLRLELAHGQRRIVTSRVRSITISPPTSARVS
jgi:hypothetical protein